MGTGKVRDSELADLTASMVMNIVFFAAVFWIFPFIPMVIVLLYGLPFTTFVTLWLIELPFSGLAFYIIFKTRR